jgi:carbon-monoxide dehydrogenase medium subunit
MNSTKEYNRPTDLQEALALLQRKDVVTVPLAGGSWLAPRLHAGVPGSVAGKVDAVVDLAQLGLSYVEQKTGETGTFLCIGATTTLAELAGHDDCRQLATGLLAKAAQREGPINLRNTATIGGCIARADGDSELLLALLVLATEVTINDGQERRVELTDFLDDPASAIGSGLITEVRIPWATGLDGGSARVSRTPSDRAIVAAAAVSDGQQGRIAIGGLAPSPTLLHIEDVNQGEEAIADAVSDQPAFEDFQGSVEYRQAMAPIVARRALASALDSLD